MRKHTRTFKKGIHFPDMKYLAKDKPIEPMPPSEHYFVALSQHIGAPAKPVVEVGATVAAGTLIARADGMISANVFSPVSGTVAGIETRKNKQGANAPFIHIKNDFKNREEFMPPADVSDARAVRERIGEAGIVGLGGAGFPTLVKLSPSKPVDILIINAAECEPYLTCDYRVMLDRTEEFVKGVKILSSCLGVARTVIGIEENKMEAYEKLRAFDGFELILLEKKYPQGGEKQLIYLRNIKKVFLEAKTAPGANDTLTDADALKIIQKLTKQGKDAAEIYVQQGRQDLADAELAQVKVMEAYLPKQMSPEELEAALKEIIAETGATSGKDMGKVMGVASKKLAGLAEGRAISAKVKELLG